MKRSLPVLQGKIGAINPDGTRRALDPKPVSGRFNRVRRVAFALLVLILLAAPFVRIAGVPLVLLDIVARRFFLFGQGYNAQDVWLLFFLLSGMGFALFVATTLWGRLWCGYACPQTVFLEGLFRPIEHAIEGSLRERRRRAKSRPREAQLRMVAKHGVYILLSLGLAFVTMGYFVPFRYLLTQGSAHPVAWLLIAITAGVFYGNFARFREQTCLVLCPYGRLQSALLDEHSLVIGYDEIRGEPRGKVSKKDRGDCIDCGLCVAVCPTGIDIRNGLQMECIGCAACIDACDGIMAKVKQRPGLIRYDSNTGFEGGKRKFWRPRVGIYALAGAIGCGVAMTAFASRTGAEVSLTRGTVPFALIDGKVHNLFVVHVVNKSARTAHLQLSAKPDPRHAVSPMPVKLVLQPHHERQINLVVRLKANAVAPGQRLTLVLTDTTSGKQLREVSAEVLGPARGGAP